MTPRTQMVMLLAPNTSARRLYSAFKRMCCTQLPVITQVVKSETIRKRHSIAQLLMRIVLQFNSKLSGPPWHVMIKSKDMAGPPSPLLAKPTMLIGIDTRVDAGYTYLGVSASLNRFVSEYFTKVETLSWPSGQNASGSSTRGEALQKLVSEALTRFAHRNEGVLPSQLIVYRGSCGLHEIESVRAGDLAAIQRAAQLFPCGESPGEKAQAAYAPDIALIGITKVCQLRFFKTRVPDPDFKPPPGTDLPSLVNPTPGTVVDGPSTYGDLYNFYMVSHLPMRGTAVPVHYLVIHDSASLNPHALQTLTHMMTHMYFNTPGAVRLPAPLMYARKAADFVGRALKTSVHDRLVESFYFL